MIDEVFEFMSQFRILCLKKIKTTQTNKQTKKQQTNKQTTRKHHMMQARPTKYIMNIGLQLFYFTNCYQNLEDIY
jgi:hypothetical protein